MEGNICGLMWSFIIVFTWRGWGKSCETSVRNLSLWLPEYKACNQTAWFWDSVSLANCWLWFLWALRSQSPSEWADNSKSLSRSLSPSSLILSSSFLMVVHRWMKCLWKYNYVIIVFVSCYVFEPCWRLLGSHFWTVASSHPFITTISFNRVNVNNEYRLRSE